MSVYKSRIFSTVIVSLITLGCWGLLSSTSYNTWPIPGEQEPANKSTQINHVAEVTMTKTYINKTDTFIVNGPNEKHTILSYQAVFKPATGEASIELGRSAQLPTAIVSRLKDAQEGSFLILDNVTASYEGKRKRLLPALYKITAE